MFRNPLIDAAVVLIAVLLIFGPKRLPLVGRSLGQGLREFKGGISGDTEPPAEEARPALPQSTAAPAVAAPASPHESAELGSRVSSS